MTATAFLLVAIDGKTLQVRGFGVFSEERPTQIGIRWATVHREEGKDLDEACRFIAKAALTWLRWTLPRDTDLPVSFEDAAGYVPTDDDADVVLAAWRATGGVPR